MLLHFELVAGLFHQGAFAVDHLDHVNVFGVDNEDILGGHGQPGFHFAFEAYEILFGLPDGFLQHVHIGDADLFLAGQQHVDVTVLDMAFPDGLLLGHGLVVETVDKSLAAVDFVAALVQGAQVGG